MSSTEAAKLGPELPLPHMDEFTSTDEYVNSLLAFVGTNYLLRTFCGGVHILDFFTSEPSLYSRVLPQQWRDFFTQHEVMDILDLMMRDDLLRLTTEHESVDTWKNGAVPPASLITYIKDVRKHLLNRDPGGTQCSRNRAMKPTQKLARHVAVGMNVKKVHEVGLFASYIDKLTSALAPTTEISHLVDFGSGQNYLGRALASQPYNKSIVAIESKQANAERAKAFDVMARLATKKVVMRNKKAFRAGVEGSKSDTSVSTGPAKPPTPPPEPADSRIAAPAVEVPEIGTGKIQYVEHRIQDGDLKHVISAMPATASNKNLTVMSLHSCGNLVHHGLRSLLLNPEVKAVAMVGCCYNLVTERLGPATYKLPELRPTMSEHPRLKKLGEACDPHGFPMSQRMCEYYYGNDCEDEGECGVRGVRLNITARMMAVQAPANWGVADSEDFFTRHFFRALLQRIFLDRGIVGPPTAEYVGGASPAGHTSGGTPIVIGSLRKSCYESFVLYVRGALAKLVQDPERGELFQQKMGDMTDDEIRKYEDDYRHRKKELSVIWSLMAFSAGVIEATIVVDRWLWLKEQDEVKEAWVEPVFDYRLSPRNLVVVGIKK